jgi:hypothetical protein
METETQTEVVAEAIADAASEIVAENNAALENAEAVNEAIVGALAESEHIRHMQEIEARYEATRAETLERLATCETRLMETTTALEATRAEVLKLSSIQATSQPLVVVEDGLRESPEVLEAITAPEAVEPPIENEPPPPPPRKKRHLI